MSLELLASGLIQEVLGVVFQKQTKLNGWMLVTMDFKKTLIQLLVVSSSKMLKMDLVSSQSKWEEMNNQVQWLRPTDLDTNKEELFISTWWLFLKNKPKMVLSLVTWDKLRLQTIKTVLGPEEWVFNKRSWTTFNTQQSKDKTLLQVTLEPVPLVVDKESSSKNAAPPLRPVLVKLHKDNQLLTSGSLVSTNLWLPLTWQWTSLDKALPLHVSKVEPWKLLVSQWPPF